MANPNPPNRELILENGAKNNFKYLKEHNPERFAEIMEKKNAAVKEHFALRSAVKRFISMQADDKFREMFSALGIDPDRIKTIADLIALRQIMTAITEGKVDSARFIAELAGELSTQGTGTGITPMDIAKVDELIASVKKKDDKE